MKASGLKVRVIAPLAVICLLVGLSGSLAQAQVPRAGTFPPTSGALVTITNGSGNVLVNVYDSQIHSGVVQPVPFEIGSSNCNANDALYPTDAYVLQGGSWTGCDPGDAFEITDSNTSGAAHQAYGKTDISGFHIETHYLCGGSCDAGISGPIACNSTNTICANPDTGFLTVTNNTGSAFIGTITLQGNSSIAGGSSCANNGAAFDTVTYTSEVPLAISGSVTLALGTEITPDPAGLADSSNCGGFNAPQTAAIQAGTTTIFQIGSDDLQITPANSNAGDTLTLLPVPVPAGPLNGTKFGSEMVTYPTSPFSAGSDYPSTETIIPYSDFSALGNPAGMEYQLTCTPAPETTSDCSTFANTIQVDFTVDKNSFPSGVGGVQFLAEHDGSPAGYLGQCPTEGFDVDIIFSYTATTPDPIRSKSSGNSCFVATFSPAAPAVAAGTTVTSKTFQGFYFPVSDTKLNLVEDGSPVPLSWQTFDNVTGKPVTNLTICPNTTGAGCTAPWVSVGTFPVSCSNTSEITGPLVPAPGKALFLNFRNGLYTYNLNTVRGSTGCFTPALTFSTSVVSYSIANFKFI